MTWLVSAFELGLRGLVPWLSGLLAVLVDVLPLPHASPFAPAPLVTVCVVAFWLLERPDLMTPARIFALGLVVDAAAGQPLGHASLALLAIATLLLPARLFLRGQPALLVWACFMVTVLAVETVRWASASLLVGRALPIQPLALEGALTIAVWPLVRGLLTPLSRRLLAPDHARGA